MNDQTTYGVDYSDSRTHVETRHEQPKEPSTMTPEQFEKLMAFLEKTLTPGYELSLKALAKLAAESQAAPAAESPTDTQENTGNSAG